MRKIIFILLLGLSAIFFACQKELSVIIMESEQCKITMAHYYGGGGMHDSAQFIYNNDKLVKWINIDGYYDYYYSGNNIVARIYKENAGPIWYVDSIRYNSDNTVKEMVFYDFSGQYGGDTLHSKVIFNYQGGRVNDLVTVEYFDYGFGPETDSTFTTLTWNAAGNIEKMRFVNNGYYGFDDSVLYQYDANPNYFKLIHPHFFVLDPQFELQVGFETLLAYFYSKNNVTNFNVYGSWDYPIVYGLDSSKNVTSITMSGFPYMEYEYDCDPQ